MAHGEMGGQIAPMEGYPLVMTNSLLLKLGPIEIADLPIDSMVIFHSFFVCLPKGNTSLGCGEMTFFTIVS